METNTDKQDVRKIEEALSKIAVTKEADRILTDLISRVNEGFEAGKALKQDVASYIICEFGNRADDVEIQNFRSMFFNPILLMEATLKRAKETGILSESIREALFQQFQSHNASTQLVRKPKRMLKPNLIIDKVKSESEAA